MSLHSCTRRRALHVGVGALTALAGCNGTDRSDPPEPDHETDVIDGVDVYTYWFDTDEREVVVGEGGGRPRFPYVISDDDVDPLELRDEPVDADVADDGPDDPLEALDGIDYDEATGIVIQANVEACYRQSFQYAARRTPGDDSDGISVQFCTTKRDPDVACSLGDRQAQVTVLGVPIAYETRPSGSGRGRSSSCRLPPDHPAYPVGDRE